MVRKQEDSSKRSFRVPAFRPNLYVDETLTALRPVLESGWVTQGPQVERLEQLLSEWSDEYVVAVSSGQHALEICLELMKKYHGYTPDRPKVVMPACAFVGDVMALKRCGFNPLFVDVDDNMQIDYECFDSEIQRGDVAGVLVVNLGGTATPYLPNIELDASEESKWSVMDGCQSQMVDIEGMGSVYSMCDMSCTSFYATKVLTAGEGGAVFASKMWQEKMAKQLRNNGRISMFDTEHEIIAGDCRMSDILATVALVQLRHAEESVLRRKRIADRYREAIRQSTPWRVMEYPGVESNWYKFMVDPGPDEKRSREEITDHFAEYGVQLAGPVYEHMAFEAPAFDSRATDADEFPKAYYLTRAHFCLPIYDTMTEEETDAVVTAIKVYR